MDNLLKLSEWIQIYGIGYVVLAFVLLILTTIFFKIILPNPKLTNALIDWMLRKTHGITMKTLKKHPIFNNKYDYLYRIKYICFGNQYYKTHLLQLFLETKIETDVSLLHFFLNNENIEKTKNLRKLFENTIEDMVQEFDMRIQAALFRFCDAEIASKTKNYTRHDVKVFSEELYKYLMYSKGGYFEKREYRLAVIHKDISNMINNPLYKSNNKMTYKFFDIVDSTLDDMVDDTKKIYAKFNGGIEAQFSIFIKDRLKL